MTVLSIRARFIALAVLTVASAGLSQGSAFAQGLNASIIPAPVAKAATAMRALSNDEQLTRAFMATRGAGPSRDRLKAGAVGAHRSAALAWTTSGAAFIIQSRADNPSPDDIGALDVYYLQPEGATFKVMGAYPRAIEGSPLGGPPQWVVSTDFGDHPIVVADTFGVWQGVACTTTALYELGGGEPIALGAFRSGYDNIGAEGQSPRAVSITGSIRNIIKGRSFEVHFDGTSRFTQVFARHGSTYVEISGDGELPAC